MATPEKSESRTDQSKGRDLRQQTAAKQSAEGDVSSTSRPQTRTEKLTHNDQEESRITKPGVVADEARPRFKDVPSSRDEKERRKDKHYEHKTVERADCSRHSVSANHGSVKNMGSFSDRQKAHRAHPSGHTKTQEDDRQHVSASSHSDKFVEGTRVYEPTNNEGKTVDMQSSGAYTSSEASSESTSTKSTDTTAAESRVNLKPENRPDCSTDKQLSVSAGTSDTASGDVNVQKDECMTRYDAEMSEGQTGGLSSHSVSGEQNRGFEGHSESTDKLAATEPTTCTASVVYTTEDIQYPPETNKSELLPEPLGSSIKTGIQVEADMPESDLGSVTLELSAGTESLPSLREDDARCSAVTLDSDLHAGAVIIESQCVGTVEGSSEEAEPALPSDRDENTTAEDKCDTDTLSCADLDVGTVRQAAAHHVSVPSPHLHVAVCGDSEAEKKKDDISAFQQNDDSL